MGFFTKSKKDVPKGRVVKNYGVLNEHAKGIVRYRHSLLLVEQGSRRMVVLEESSPLVGMQNRYFEFDKAGAARLKNALEDVLKFL